MLREWLWVEGDRVFSMVHSYSCQDSYDKVLGDLDYTENILILS